VTTVGGYEFVYQGFKEDPKPNGDHVSSAIVDVKLGGKKIAQMMPGQTQFANRPEGESGRLDAAVDVQFLRDVFVVFQGGEADRGLSFNVKINPMISWAWVGFLITILGTAIAMWPKRERALEAVPAPRKKKTA
jgi:cytochrome c-type biogenesis protein CcmF